jgi:DNA-binding NarL/FixJ family response regulator
MGDFRLEQINVFLVEDQTLLAIDLKNRLENLNYKIVGTADNGVDAVTMIGETKPDIILMDIVLKGNLNGIETAKQIREFYNIPFIYLTAYYDDKMLDEAAETQPDGYITKPYGDISLHTSIQIAILKRKYIATQKIDSKIPENTAENLKT